MNYFELKQRIQDYTENTESTFVAEIDDFILNTEERIFEELELNLFKKEDSSGTFTAGTKTVVAPEDYLNSISMSAILSDGREVPLKKKHQTFIDDYIGDPTDVGLRATPKYYGDFDAELYKSSSSGSTIIVGPVPDSAISYRLAYYFKPASMTKVKVFRSVTLGANPIATGTAGSSTLTITDSSHGADEQTLVLLSGSAAVDSVAAATINTTLPHNIKTVTTNTYQIDVHSTSSSVQTGAGSGSTSGGGSSVTAVYMNGATSWIGDYAETALFYGCMIEAGIFMRQPSGDGSMIALMEGRYQAEIARLKARYQGRGRMEARRYDNARVEPV